MKQEIEVPYHITLLLCGILFISARNADYNRQRLDIARSKRWWPQRKIDCVCSCAKSMVKPEQKQMQEMK